MASVQSFIRAMVKHGEFPAPKGIEAFAAYAIATNKQLIPEMENAARQTLDLPKTFEYLGEALRLFDCSALRDLANFRKRCRDSIIPSLDVFLKNKTGPSSIWVGCPEVILKSSSNWGFVQDEHEFLPRWLSQLLLSNQKNFKLQEFTHPLNIHSRIRGEYNVALKNHGNCHFCLGVHLSDGLAFCTVLRYKLVQARDKVTYSL